jgi:hypothetical protein
MIAPMHIMTEPPRIDQRLPNLSLMIGMKGRDKIPPREYAAAMIPLSEPWGLLKSTTGLTRSDYVKECKAIHLTQEGTI